MCAGGLTVVNFPAVHQCCPCFLSAYGFMGVDVVSLGSLCHASTWDRSSLLVCLTKVLCVYDVWVYHRLGQTSSVVLGWSLALLHAEKLLSCVVKVTVFPSDNLETECWHAQLLKHTTGASIKLLFCFG